MPTHTHHGPRQPTSQQSSPPTRRPGRRGPPPRRRLVAPNLRPAPGPRGRGVATAVKAAGRPHRPGAAGTRHTAGSSHRAQRLDQLGPRACFPGQPPRSALPTDSKSRTSSADAHGPARRPRGLDRAVNCPPAPGAGRVRPALLTPGWGSGPRGRKAGVGSPALRPRVLSTPRSPGSLVPGTVSSAAWMRESPHLRNEAPYVGWGRRGARQWPVSWGSLLGTSQAWPHRG